VERGASERALSHLLLVRICMCMQWWRRMVAFSLALPSRNLSYTVFNQSRSNQRATILRLQEALKLNFLVRSPCARPKRNTPPHPLSLNLKNSPLKNVCAHELEYDMSTRRLIYEHHVVASRYHQFTKISRASR
jgi:hypothetical protein